MPDYILVEVGDGWDPKYIAGEIEQVMGVKVKATQEAKVVPGSHDLRNLLFSVS